MVEQARTVTVASGSYKQYPAPLAKYDEVVADRNLFMTSLEKLHSVVGTKFMIPIIGGKDLDLHKLFVEVTSRGGIEVILKEKRWKEVTSTFNFPSTATNASFILRKYYYSLLQHYEQIYYFKVQARGSSSTGALQGSNAVPGAVHEFPNMPPAPHQAPSLVDTEQSGVAASSVGTPIVGVIDGKFDSGYLVTVRIGKDTLKGVLYQVPPAHVNQVAQPSNLSTDIANSTLKSDLSRKRKRRKKSELRKRDPSHPKPNRSGYNFFFAEQHAKLKALHPGKEREITEISRKIGELWTNLEDDEKAVYQEQAMKDKERYRMEMEDYKEKLSEEQVISDAVPLRQRFPYFHVNMVGVDVNDGTQGNFSGTPEDDTDSSQIGTDDDDDDIDTVKDDNPLSDTEVSPAVGVESSNANANAFEDFQIVQEDDEKPFEDSEGNSGDDEHVLGEANKNLPSEAEI